MAQKQLQSQKIKMAMALLGKNKHYHWHNIQRRHFLETAKTVNFSVKRAEFILDDMLSKVDNVIAKVSPKIPSTFPKIISNSIFDGMRFMKSKLEKKHPS